MRMQLCPNPYPKRQYEKRRWHAHHVFSQMPHLSPLTILLSNWLDDLEQTAIVASQLGFYASIWQHHTQLGDAPTHFEQKYCQHQVPVYELRIVGLYKPDQAWLIFFHGLGRNFLKYGSSSYSLVLHSPLLHQAYTLLSRKSTWLRSSFSMSYKRAH